MIRFGILGFGLHAVKRVMPGFAAAKNCRVIALSRRDIGKAQESARRFNIPLAFDSAEELCRSSEVYAVFVTTPNACHLSDVSLAINCGKPVLCEKPMAVNADECRRMVEAAREANLLLGVAQVFRFENSTARLRERIAAGQIGRPIFARSEFSFQAAGGHPRTWLYDPAVAGGGPIADVGVHCVDALRYSLPGEALRVSARGMQDTDSGELEAAGAVILEFSRGTLASVLVSYRSGYRTPIEFVGQNGVLRADDGLNVEHPITLELRRDGAIAESETVLNQGAYASQEHAFAAAGGATAELRGFWQRGSQDKGKLDAAYRSLKSGKAEPVERVVGPLTSALSSQPISAKFKG